MAIHCIICEQNTCCISKCTQGVPNKDRIFKVNGMQNVEAQWMLKASLYFSCHLISHITKRVSAFDRKWEPSQTDYI